MAQSEFIFDVSESEFPQAVLERSRTVPVVVDFWAPWCGPCRNLAPVLERLVAERNGQVLLAKVNIDEAQQLAASLGVEAIPHVIAFRDGKGVVDFVGLLPEAQLREFLDRLSPSEADNLAKQAAAVEKDRADEAEKLYRQALASDRRHEGAMLGLARLLVEQNKNAEANELLEELAGGAQADEVERLRGLIGVREQAATLGTETTIRQRLQTTPEDAEAWYNLGVVLAVQGKYKEALEALLTAGQRNYKLAESKVRPMMVNVFKVIGVRDPLADEYRQKLSMLLY